MTELYGGRYHGRKVLVTGHTGFKGSWLSYWLKRLGAEVVGFALEAPTEPSHFALLDLKMTSVIGDIRDRDALERVFAEHRPEIVFHLAAQPLVRLSYDDPVTTYETNVMGTMNVLETCRKTDSVKAIVNVTSDKCYDNKEWVWGYRENDAMGGYDPYSSSKGCAEILAGSYRSSYFNPEQYKKSHHTLLASCRAGNVIGGGDWAKDRLMTDIMLAASRGETVAIRNPQATRPWQHVLEPLSGYLHIGQKLLEEKPEFAEGWNFGPSDEGSITVREVAEAVMSHWDKVRFDIQQTPDQPHEANLLKLDCSKAHMKLHWKNVWESSMTFEKTVEWYKAYYETDKVVTENDLLAYIDAARAAKIAWAV